MEWVWSLEYQKLEKQTGRKFMGERKFKALTLLKWLIMKSKLGRGVADEV